MAYNLITEIPKDVNLKEIRDFILDEKGNLIEAFPINASSSDTSSYLGVSIPYFKLDNDPEAWRKIERFLLFLIEEKKLKVFDLYLGIYLSKDELPKFKKALYG